MQAQRIRTRITGFRRDESGAMAVFVAFLLLLLLGMATLAIDYGRMAWIQYELKKAADAGALAGARGLWPQDLSTATNRDPDCATAATEALNTTTSNKVDGVYLASSEVTVEVGQWDYATKKFNPGINNNANGVRVITQRAKVNTILAGILGIFSKDLSASSIAIMDFAGALGGGSMPVAINKMYAAEPNGTPLTIVFGPSGIDNGGWFAKQPDSCDSKVIGSYIVDGACPALAIGDILNLGNGQIDSSIKDLSDKLASQGGTLYTMVPVVETTSFNQAEPIIGFVPFEITEVHNHGNPKYITGLVLDLGVWKSAQPGPHPGGSFGALTPPKLVE
jgi:Flp pilus assembly protein TadG